MAWSRAKHCSAKGDLEAASHWLQRAEHGESRPQFKLINDAFKATILLRQHRFDEAEHLFDSVARRTDPPQSENERYVNLFVRSIRAEIDGDSLLEQRLLREAQRVECRPVLRRWLPIAEPDSAS